MRALEIHHRYQNDLLLSGLKRFFGDFDAGTLQRIFGAFEWLEVSAGEMVFDEGAPGEDMFFLVSGRLRATVDSSGSRRTVVGEMFRGEAIGEMALITGELRTARVTAVRPSVLVRLSRAAFYELVREHPSVSIRLMRLLIERLRRAESRQSWASARLRAGRPASIVLLPSAPGMDVESIAAELASRLSRWGRSLFLTQAIVRGRFEPAVAAARETAAGAHIELTRWLDEVEAQHDFLLCVADPEDSAWTRQCLSRADEILVVAGAGLPAALHPVEGAGISGNPGFGEAAVRLVLVHGPGSATPRGTAAQLDARNVVDHVHLREGSARDLDRLARVISGNSVGLVLSGGAAHGFAHLGVYQALVEAGIDIDCVGGTSMGAAVGSLIALDLDPAEAIQKVRRFFHSRPLGDYNLLPFVSLLAGRRLESALLAAYRHPDGSQPGIEDTWKRFFCIATNYSLACEKILQRGPLAQLVRASLSIPVYLPPVFHDREALIDGALFNNFPADVMRQGGIGFVIGVDLAQKPFGSVSAPSAPRGMGLLLRQFTRRRDSDDRIPWIAGMLYHSPMLASRSRQASCAALVDLLIQPDLSSVRSFDWGAMDRTIELGYRAARAQIERVAAADPAQLEALRPGGPTP